MQPRSVSRSTRIRLQRFRRVGFSDDEVRHSYRHHSCHRPHSHVLRTYDHVSRIFAWLSSTPRLCEDSHSPSFSWRSTIRSHCVCDIWRPRSCGVRREQIFNFLATAMAGPVLPIALSPLRACVPLAGARSVNAQLALMAQFGDSHVKRCFCLSRFLNILRGCFVPPILTFSSL